ncbi:asparagine synthase (glutamine-hydrolyzing) [soil metagenome]
MCGITGLWSPSVRRDLRSTVDAMTGCLRHRGPDADGRWLDEDRGLALGHRRLAVVGLGEVGAQPMTSRSGRWTVTYNGEIYNAPALGKQLEAAGVAFRGTSDTEVLVAALEHFGPARTLELIDGMFAFGAWDAEEHRLVLARDRMGEKPLVYGALAGGGVAFASELGPLRTLAGFDAGIDPAAVALFLRFKYVPAPWTIHTGARKLPAAHWLEVRDGGRTIGAPQAYWSLSDVVEAGARSPLPDGGETLDGLDEVLQGAVRSQLRADVPLGAFLSGGIDSSLVATLAAEQLQHPLKTFTIASPDPDLDESSHAREVARRLGADHTQLEVTAAEALTEVPALAAHWDEPFADSSQLPTLLVARLARRDVTVVLSGDGGDELFGGYNRHLWLPRTWERVGRLPAPARRGIGRALARPSPASWDRVGRLLPEQRRPRLLGLKAQKFAGLLGAADEADAYGRLVSHWQDPASVVTGASEPRTLVHRRGEWPAVGLAAQVMAVDALTYLPDDVLVKVDRATMAVALEARVPLLDRSVVERAAALPADMKIRAGEGKWALRELLARRHPRSLFERPKSGFGIPIASWLGAELRPWAEDLLSQRSLEKSGLLDPAPVRAVWAQHLAGNADRSYEIWDVLMLQSWLQQSNT